MSLLLDEMDEDYDESDNEFELITVNPNVDYESDDTMEEEELSQNCKEAELQIPMWGESLNNQEDEIEIKAEIVSDKMDEVSCDSIVKPIDDDNSINSCDLIRKSRKKLNLQEYKMRRANEIPDKKPLFDVPRKIAAYELCDVPSLPLLILPTDPNWAAKIENEIEQEPQYSWNDMKVTFNPNLYEEIIKVSIGCNTEVTIPPIEEKEESIVKSIVNNLNKDDAGSLLQSSTTLFSSIQEVMHKKCVSTETKTEQTCDNQDNGSDEPKEHGEDKTIMHLRKDRLRPFKCSVGLQTDDISLFPPLLLSPSLIFNRIRSSRNYRRNKSRSRSRSRSYSPSELEYDRVRYQNSKRCSRSQHSTHSSSLNSDSDSESDSNLSDCSSRSESSDSLQRLNKRQNFRFYNRNQRDQGYNYQGEQRLLFWHAKTLFNLFVVFCTERKIVYIGGLEEETTKDEIRRKFLHYGTIKKISFHSKDDG